MEAFSVHGAPSEYVLLAGVLNELEGKLLERGLRKVLVVHGEKSWNAAKPFWPVFADVSYSEYSYSGECSLTEIDHLVELVTNQKFDGVIGVGGGKVLDLVKAVTHLVKKPSVLIPTLASNCSPWTPISVIYDEQGTFIRFDVYPVGASLVLVDPRILITAPVELLIAGIGDTLAKWYEADVQMAVIPDKPIALQISHYAAKQCKEVLLQHAEGAIQAARSEVLNEDFVKVAETIIMLGGMVGGFGDHYGRIAGAHAIHNGLTVLEETHHALHGDKVAYGILIQLVLEKKWEEIEKLLPFYQRLGLPISLRELGVTEIDEAKITRIAEKATHPSESIHVMPIGTITSEDVGRAIRELEGVCQSTNNLVS